MVAFFAPKILKIKLLITNWNEQKKLFEYFFVQPGSFLWTFRRWRIIFVVEPPERSTNFLHSLQVALTLLAPSTAKYFQTLLFKLSFGSSWSPSWIIGKNLLLKNILNHSNKLMVPRCQSHPSMFENHLHHLEVKRFDGHQYCRLRGCHQT